MLLYRIKICCSSLGPTLRYPPFFHHPRVKIAWFFAWEPPFQTWTSPISHGMSLSYVCSIHQLKHVETTFESCPKKLSAMTQLSHCGEDIDELLAILWSAPKKLLVGCHGLFQPSFNTAFPWSLQMFCFMFPYVLRISHCFPWFPHVSPSDVPHFLTISSRTIVSFPSPSQLRQPHAAPHGSPCHFPRPVAQRSRRPPDNADFVLFLF